MRSLALGAWVVSTIALAMLLSALPAAADTIPGVYYLEKYTAEGATTDVPIPLIGGTVVSAYFNFTLTDDVLGSKPDSFIFTVTNVDDPSIRQSLPGTTDVSGTLTVSMPFTRPASPRWKVDVQCTVAGDLMLGPIVRQADGGNDWQLQVDYVYEPAKPSDGGGGGGGGSGGGNGGQSLVVTAFQGNLVVVALLSAVAVIASVRGRGPSGRLVVPYALGAVILLDAFVALPFALLINIVLNDTTIARGALGPAWLGNLAIVLLVVWLVPPLVTVRRVLTSDTFQGGLARSTSPRFARSMGRFGRRFQHDVLSHGRVSDMLSGIGVASAAVAVLMLALTM